MRIGLTKYGLPQVVIFPLVFIILMAVCFFFVQARWVLWLVESLLAVILIWVLSFFRDPHRKIVADCDLLLAPADGTIYDIETIDENDFIGGSALRIGIFLSVFNVHINRSPCNAVVEKINYKKGKFKDARDPQAFQINESNDLWLVRTDSPKDKLVVRQISGAIARRIVCATTAGEKLAGGQQFGMIKFGSRTELYLPSRENAKVLVKKGDKVKAGLTQLIKYS
ncbi:MAG: phosphatidylserine decarboxylase [Planctomycetota bacterium]|jgi:phosphatidylserine decarboxylase